MVISYQNNDTVSLKTKTETISLGKEVKIGSFTIPTAGEYDVATIQCEAHYTAKAMVYFLRSEDLTITYLTDVDTDVAKLDDASNTDILVVELRSDSEASHLKSIIGSLEPGYLLLIGSKPEKSFLDTLGLTNYESSTLKVSRSSLPMEGTQLVPQD